MIKKYGIRAGNHDHGLAGVPARRIVNDDYFSRFDRFQESIERVN